MFEWLGIGKAAASEVKDRVEKHHQHKRELRWDFILEAVGPEPPSCLELPTHSDCSVSFSTIERRVWLLHKRRIERGLGNAVYQELMIQTVNSGCVTFSTRWL